MTKYKVICGDTANYFAADERETAKAYYESVSLFSGDYCRFEVIENGKVTIIDETPPEDV